MLKNLMKTLTSARSATHDALTVIDAIRESIAERKAAIEALERAPLPAPEALARFDAWADDLATKAMDSTRPDRLVDPSAVGGLHTPTSPEAMMGMLVLACRDKLRAVIAGQIADLTEGRETLTDAARAKKIADELADLHMAELLEERAIRDLEAAGITVARRPDASPPAVLASDEALPR